MDTYNYIRNTKNIRKYVLVFQWTCAHTIIRRSRKEHIRNVLITATIPKKEPEIVKSVAGYIRKRSE